MENFIKEKKRIVSMVPASFFPVQVLSLLHCFVGLVVSS